MREFAAEEVAEDETRDFAFLDTVLPLSRAWRLKSCISARCMGYNSVCKFACVHESGKEFRRSAIVIKLCRKRFECERVVVGVVVPPYVTYESSGEVERQ